MPNVSPLHELALLYLAVVLGADDDLSYAEREAVTDNLHRRYAYLNRAEVQNVVLEESAAHDIDALHTAAHDVIDVLGSILEDEEKREVLADLNRIAQADGVVIERERRLLEDIAASWGIETMRQPVEIARSMADVTTWDALHHLAFIYLVLAHAPDSDFSEDERQLILLKLREWAPNLDDEAIRSMLERAIDRYAQGVDEQMVAASVDAVKDSLPTERRKAALNDLVQIANADGVFLDSEEDLLNALAAAWDLDAFSGYGEAEKS